MTLNYVTVILNVVDGSGNPAARGWASIAPSAQLTDPSNNVEVIPPVVAQFAAAASPSVRLLATDNATVQPPGWAWTITFQTVPGNPASYNFPLPAGPQTFTATNASPCVFTGSGAGYLNNTAVQLSGGSLPAGFAAGTTYWVVNASGSTFQLAATVSGAALASTSTGSGAVVATQSYLSTLSPVSSAATMAGYLPLPSGTPSSGQVPVATGSGEASAWGTVATNPMTTAGDMITGTTGGAPARLAIGSSGYVLTVTGGVPSWQPASGGGGFANPMTTLGDLIYENATPAAARLAGDTSNTRKFLRGQASGGVAQAPAWDTIQAGDVPTLNQNTTGTAANVTGTVAVANGGTGQVTASAALNALGGAAVAGDIGGTSASPQVTATHLASALPIAQGGTGQGTQQAALDALAGAVTSGSVLRGNGTHVTLAALQAGDIPDLAYVDTVTAGDSSVTVTGAADTPSLTSVPAQYAQRIFAV